MFPASVNCLNSLALCSLPSFSHCTTLALTLLSPSAFKASARVYQPTQIMQAKLLRLKSESQEHQFPFTRKHTTVKSSGDSNVDTFEVLLFYLFPGEASTLSLPFFQVPQRRNTSEYSKPLEIDDFLYVAG